MSDHKSIVTPLHARTFAAWTLTSAVVRIYAAYNINDKRCVYLLHRDLSQCSTLVFRLYDMALLTYLIAFGHFTSEILIFRTAKINTGIAGPLVVASKLARFFSRKSCTDAISYFTQAQPWSGC
jgi:hypothetical protein